MNWLNYSHTLYGEAILKIIFSIVVNCIFMFDFDNQTRVTAIGLPDVRFRFVTKIPTEIYNTQGGCRFTTFEIVYII